MNSHYHNILSPHLGRYEKTLKDGVRHVWGLYYEGGSGEKVFYRLRWGRLGAKKLQSRTVNINEAYRLLHKNRANGFVLVDGSVKDWSDVQQQIIAEAVSQTPQSVSKPRKM